MVLIVLYPAHRVSKVLLATLDLREQTVLTVLMAHRVAETYTQLAAITSQQLTHSLPDWRAIEVITIRESLLAYKLDYLVRPTIL